MGLGGAIGGIVSGVLGAKGAKDAAKSQEKAAQNDIAFQKETRDLIIDRVDPFYQAGLPAQQAYLYNLGLGPAPVLGGQAQEVTEFTDTVPSAGVQGFTRTGGRNEGQTYFKDAGPQNRQRFRVGEQVFDSREAADEYATANPVGGTTYEGFQQSPGYQWAFDQGTAGVNALAGARGGLNSGRTMQDLTKFGQGIANQEWGNYMNRLAGLTDASMGAASLQANASQNAAAGVSNALAGIGNAQAAGSIGAANAISGGINNAVGAFQYQSMLNKIA